MKKLIPIFASLALIACSQDNSDQSASGYSVASVDQAVALNELVEAYFEETIARSPIGATFIGDNRFNDQFLNSLAPEFIDESLAIERRYLAMLREIDASQLEGQDLLSYEIFELNREIAIEGAEFPVELIPVNQMFSMPSFFPVLGSGQSAQPFATVEDYDNWLSRVEGFVPFMDQIVINLRRGIEEGVIQPRVVMEKVLPQLQAHIIESIEESLFYGPIANMPEDFSEEDRVRLTEAYSVMIEEQIVPAYQRLADFIETEYMPATRETVGWAALPGGEDWYNYQIATNTTTSMTADEVHELGLAEVARIRGEMKGVMEEVGFEGTLEEFFEFLETDEQFQFESTEELMAAYEDAKIRINALLPSMFSTFPKSDYEIREIEEFRAQSSAGAMYQRPSPDGSRPGIFYINTYNLKAQPTYGVETLSIHEAAPGHHFQVSIQQELDDLPKFRRFGGYTAYIEGWGLYAESIGKELGVFTDPYQYYGRLNDEMLRAMRLVVDTGLHAKGWTREEAIEYMMANSTMAESNATAEVERYIAIPGQALAYKVGQLNLTRMRAEAEEALGEGFDIREWHAQILTDGALPMDVLDAKNKRWIESQM